MTGRSRVHRRAWQLSQASGAETDFAAQFDGTSRLSVSNLGAVFSPPLDTDLWVAFWFALDTLPEAGTTAELISVSGADITKDGWYIYVNGTGNLLGMGACDGSGYTNMEFGAQALVTGTWYLALCHWDNTSGAANYAMSLWDTSGFINSVGTGGRFIQSSNPQPLKIGGTIAPLLSNACRIDKAGFWFRSAAAPINEDLWNGGAGLTGAEVAASSLNTGLIDWYDLDETTGTVTWPSLNGTHDATATGTVTRVPKAGQF